MKLIGVTGPSGSGKSILSEHWRAMGYQCLDADKIYHEMLLPPSPCVNAIVSVFGADLLLPDGTLNRKALSEKVFSDPASLIRLNETVLPLVIDEIERRIEKLRLEGERAVILDAPTLIESGLYKLCDTVIAVLAPKEERLARIMERDSLDRPSAVSRISAQHNEEFYRGAADFVICNDSGTDTLFDQANKILGEVLAR